MLFILSISSLDKPSTKYLKLVLLEAFNNVAGLPKLDFILYPTLFTIVFNLLSFNFALISSLKFYDDFILFPSVNFSSIYFIS